MRILIVAATTGEIEPSLPLGSSGQVEFLITGVGMVATAYHLGRKLALEKSVDLVVNVGIAGAIDRSLSIGQVVNVVEDTFTELGAEDGEKWLSIDQLNFGRGTFSTKHSEQDAILEGLQNCKGITVNSVHGNTDSIDRLVRLHPHVQVESMEGAAVLFAAQQEQVPVLQVRAISNFVEKRNRESWNIPLAIQNLNAWLADFIASKIQ